MIHNIDSPTKITQVIQRGNGSEVRIVAEKFFGRGLTCSIDVRVHHRASPDHQWKLASNMPHPNWREMSVDEYTKNGRSEMLQLVSPGELMKVTSALSG